MFPSSSADVAVSHFSNWSAANWIIGYALLGIAVLLAGFAVSLRTSAKYTAPVGVYGWSVAAGVLAVVVQAVTLWQVARHIEQFRWMIVLTVLVVAAVALVTYRAARTALVDVYRDSYYSPSVEVPMVAIPTGVSGVVALGVIIGDGATRAAASFPTTVGGFIVLVILGAVALVVYARSSN